MASPRGSAAAALCVPERRGRPVGGRGTTWESVMRVWCACLRSRKLTNQKQSAKAPVNQVRLWDISAVNNRYIMGLGLLLSWGQWFDYKLGKNCVLWPKSVPFSIVLTGNTQPSVIIQ